MVGNRFDERAATWDQNPDKVRRAELAATTIAGAIPLDERTRMLEYGAGTGVVSQTLRDRVGAQTVADSSAGMLEQLRAKVAAGVLPGTRVWDLDLTRDRVPDEQFELVVTVMALHHIPDVEAVLDAFAAMLVDGGHLAVVDLEKEDGSFHGADFDGHEGFDRADLTARLERAGFRDVSFQPCGEVVKPQGRYARFLATCRRSPRTA